SPRAGQSHPIPTNFVTMPALRRSRAADYHERIYGLVVVLVGPVTVCNWTCVKLMKCKVQENPGALQPELRNRRRPPFTDTDGDTLINKQDFRPNQREPAKHTCCKPRQTDADATLSRRCAQQPDQPESVRSSGCQIWARAH
ncbi:MAG: hypothetical protein OXI38_10650, partial [Bacteroidota bacterium]|nr:hypothetical protein [Bacteroidota bacterium]